VIIFPASFILVQLFSHSDKLSFLSLDVKVAGAVKILNG
jgi:hypothetical protein